MQIAPLSKSEYGDIRVFIFRNGSIFTLALHDRETDGFHLFSHRIYALDDAKEEAKKWLLMYMHRHKAKQFALKDVTEMSLAWKDLDQEPAR